MQLLQHPSLRFGQLGRHPVQEQRGLVEQPLGRAGILDDHRFGQPAELRLLPLGELLAGVDDGRKLPEPDLALDAGDELEARHVGQAEVEHHAVVAPGLQRLERGFAAANGSGLHVAGADELHDAPPSRLVVLHHQQPLDGPVHELVQRGERVAQRFLGGRLGQEVDGAEPESPLPVLLDRDDVHRDVARRRIVLEPVQNRPAIGVGQPQVQRHRGRLVLARQRQRPVGALRHQPLEPAVARQVQQDLREVGVVLRDEEDAVTLLDGAPVVADRALDDRRQHHARAGGRHRLDRLAGGVLAGAILGAGRGRLSRLQRVHHRQVQREGAAFARRAARRGSRRRAAGRSRG